MPMLKDPSAKYGPPKRINIHDRQWPSKSITKRPRWLSTDLRDGNQSLAYPMTMEQKWKYFHMLVGIGFKEIDVSFPSASDTEFNFTRRLVETPGATPDDVWLQVLSPCRKEHIRRTVDSVTGAKKAIISLYMGASDNFLDTVFGLSRDQVVATAVDCVTYARSITKDDPTQAGTRWNLVFSPEAFSDTDVDFSVRLSEAVCHAWGPTADEPMVLNLPATVETASPNVFADQVELFCRSLKMAPDTVVVSLHPHNDRGCAVAASELGLLAGATRVEGCLFGNGERTGNVDLVTLALNMYSQGISPDLDLSDLRSIRAIYEECTRCRVPERMPYSGDAVFTAYSGSHQDAINKGFARIVAGTNRSARWQVPYLAIDPRDIGSSYESLIQVNSQSGKGGVAWTLSRHIRLDIPRGMQIAFSKVIKALSDAQARTLSPAEITTAFFQTYYALSKDPRISDAHCGVAGTSITIDAAVFFDGSLCRLHGRGDTVTAAVSDALVKAGIYGLTFAVQERTLVTDCGALQGISIVECRGSVDQGHEESTWSANATEDEDRRCLLACLSAALACVSPPPKTQSAMDIIGRDLRLLQNFRGKAKTAVAFG
ncbi:Pyruvate carboxyltransferase [Macrophomina phaseolina MS6]|uniref:2-isopropylmalate synthase n=1 Tax=Macrophomina phaseolina (strain MS6) TaxID=1126212 RepID=K2RYV6_MACPH|nr:Pyruvate carboxyltransferase [Macrophomina phaseolina MS6]